MPRRFVQVSHPNDEAGLDRQQWLRVDTKHRRYLIIAEATFRRGIDAPDERDLVTALNAVDVRGGRFLSTFCGEIETEGDVELADDPPP